MKRDLEYPEADEHDPPIEEEKARTSLARWSGKAVGAGDFGDVTEDDLPW